jgi:class 3 adenylate cyclase/CHASE2 domain-containing sensor protein
MGVETSGREWWSKPDRLHLSLCTCALLTVLIFGNPLETQERQWLNQCLRWRFAMRLAPPVERSIVHLNIDAEDVRTLPSLESEYAAAARIIHEASALGARIIAFDIIFARGDPQVAQPLLDALELHRNVVLSEALSAPPGRAQLSVRIRSFPFRDAAPAPAGVINLSADTDGVLREYQLVHRVETGGYEPSLAFVVYLAALGLDWKTNVTVRPTEGYLEWKELSSSDYTSLIPRHAPLHPVLINFRCPWAMESGPAAFDYLNLRQLDALFDQTPKDAALKPLRNRIMFVSYVATGQGDLGVTAFGSHEPLISLHSNTLDDLMQARWLERTGRLADALWVCSALLILVGAHLCRSKWSLVLWWFFGMVALFATAAAVLLLMNLVVPSIATAGLWTLATIVEIGRRHTSEFMQRQRLRYTMGLYFSPRVLNDVLKNPGRLEPKRLEITVLLTDLRNSTALAELLGTEGMLNLLNRVFTVENSAVFAEDGSMEKPVGDQFLAYWGAPDPQPDAADRALCAAQTLIEGMHELSETFDAQTHELFGYGIALHAGESLIGNIGSAQFLHYGPVGDLMNATARVESLTKYYGVLAIGTGDFCHRLSRPAEARLIDRVIVKGKSVPLELYELRHKYSMENFLEITERYIEAFALYEEGKFAKAELLFQKLSTSDRASDVLAERCAHLQQQRPSDWNGIFSLTAK